MRSVKSRQAVGGASDFLRSVFTLTGFPALEEAAGATDLEERTASREDTLEDRERMSARAAWSSARIAETLEEDIFVEELKSLEREEMC